VLLLVVLSILVLFLLIAITYVVVTGQFVRASLAHSRGGSTGEDAARVVDATMYRLLVGPFPVEPLLRDLYGASGVKGNVESATSEMNGQFLYITASAAGDFSDVRGFYNGCVFTMLTGPARGCSTRVVGYKIEGGKPEIRVEAFHGFAGTTIMDSSDPDGPSFLINSRAFADEDYDAPDMNNPFLAWVSPGTETTPLTIIPTGHRPALINEQISGSGLALSQEAWDGKIVRPMPWPDGHPNFTGSNPAFDISGLAGDQVATKLTQALLYGPWDVDNDGDGVPDSIWIDPGLNVHTLPDGRRYKELVAIMCLDLDGRLNVNAHGNKGQLSTVYFERASRPSPSEAAYWPTSAVFRRGIGYGPADINLAEFLGNEYLAILNGRYGADGFPGVGTTDDPLSAVKNVGLPSVYKTGPSGYGSPPDVFGRQTVGMDQTGHPLWTWGIVNGDHGSETIDDPYELDLSINGSLGIDTPYTVAELEPVLRYFDLDRISLPQRLLNDAPQTLRDPLAVLNRTRVTTLSRRAVSWEVEDPVAVLNRTRVTTLSSHISGLDAPWPDNAGPDNWAAILPFEFFFAQKMDLNRLWGTGRDDPDVVTGNVNGTVDDPSESTAGQFRNDVPGDATPRQIYARHLYCLMLAAIDDYRFPFPEDLNDSERRKLTKRRIAQWAVNVVDFRDPDGIMTPFPYDPEPFDEGGWTPTSIVWGLEYPDLIITEATAMHDRRVKDSKIDSAGDDRPRVKYEGGDPEEGDRGTPKEVDETLDQHRIPQGSLFIELYCTGANYFSSPSPPRELYAVDASNNRVFLDLGRMTPPADGQMQYPVWRIAITKSHYGGPGESEVQSIHERFYSVDEEDRKPDSSELLSSTDPAAANRMNLTSLQSEENDSIDIERVVWFAAFDPGDATTRPDSDIIYYNRAVAPGQPVLLRPGRYALVGPRDQTYVGSQVSEADAEEVAPTVVPSLQKIAISSTGVDVTDASGSSVYTAVAGRIQPTLGIIAAAKPPEGWTRLNETARVAEAMTGVGISVSEPLRSAYYEEPTYKLDGAPLRDAYADPTDDEIYQPKDEPFEGDEGNEGNNAFPLNRDDKLRESGTHVDYKTALLQRLANPLQPWNPATNPYITVDWIPIDLTVFNGEDKKPEDFPSDAPADPDEEDSPDIGPFDPEDPEPAERPALATRQKGNGRTKIWAYATSRPNELTTGVGTSYFDYSLVHTLGYLNVNSGLGVAMAEVPSGYADYYKGAPSTPFPSLTWNNRPFVSPMELMLVPASSPSRLLHEYDVADAAASPYDDALRPSFNHLLNFYNETAGFYRLFDFVGVPSRFVRTERWYNASHARGDAAAVFLRPPFNKMPRFREPGRVNINTITDPRPREDNSVIPVVWQAITRLPDDQARAQWQKIYDSRQGYAGTGLNSSHASRFEQPFRGARHGIQHTLLRAEMGNENKKLIRHSSVSGGAHDDPTQHAFFEFDDVQRLSNLLTTKSNVFAVWITVGYFEVEQDDTLGETLGQEVGFDTGDVRRHRAFYIVDRSIPVAYEEDQKHNVDRAILLKRFIE